MDINLVAPLGAFCVALYLAFLRLGWFAPLKIFFPFLFLTLAWGWFGGLLPVNYRNFQILFLLPFLFLIFRKKESGYLLNWKKPLIVVLPVFILGIATFRSNANLFFQILTSGYDHNGHIAHFYRTYVNNGFAFGLNDNLASRNSILENGYPPLQMGSWAFIMRLFGFTVNNSTDLINIYVFFNLLTYLFIVYLVLLSFSKIGLHHLRRISVLATVSLLLLTKFSTLLISGFPPTFYGIAVLLVGLYLIRENENLSTRVNLLALTTLMILYSYQLFAIAMIPVTISVFVQLKRSFRISDLTIRNIVIPASSVLFIIPLVPISRQITGYVWDFGGIESPDFWSVLLVSAFLLISLSFSKAWDINETTAVLTIAISVIMIAYAKRFDVGAYYSIKLLYLGLFLALLSIPRILSNLHAKQKPLRYPFYFVILLCCILASQSALKTTFANSNLLQVARSILLEKKPLGDPCANRILAAAIDSDTFGDFETYSFFDNEIVNQDLRTRWLNSLNGKMTDPVFDISIPLNSSKSTSEIVRAWELKYPQFKLQRLYLKESDCIFNP